MRLNRAKWRLRNRNQQVNTKVKQKNNAQKSTPRPVGNVGSIIHLSRELSDGKRRRKKTNHFTFVLRLHLIT